MTATAPAALPHPVTELTALYTFRDRETVVDFLATPPHLVPLLVEARPEIARYFGPETPVVLEVIPDREAEGYSDLFAFIQTALPTTEAAERLDQLDEEWWLEALDRARCNLTIDIEFIAQRLDV